MTISYRSVVIAVAVWAAATPSWAQVDPLKALTPTPQKEKPKDGWHKSLSIGTNISANHSSSVVGKPDGTSVSLGLNLAGRFSYLRGPHEWLSILTVQVQQTRTPPLDTFVKSLDQFRLEESYLYNFTSVPWLAFYATLTFETQLFSGEDVRPAPTDYVIQEITGPPRTDRTARLMLTREFSPTLIGESAGLAFKLATEKELQASVRVGLAAVEAFLRSGLVIADDAATPAVVELKRTEDYTQVGAQLKLDVSGSRNTLLTYAFTADFLFPFYSSVTRGLSGADLINIDIALKVGFKLAKWMSLDYVLGVRRIPLVADVFQVWNGLLASFSFNLI